MPTDVYRSQKISLVRRGSDMPGGSHEGFLGSNKDIQSCKVQEAVTHRICEFQAGFTYPPTNWTQANLSKTPGSILPQKLGHCNYDPEDPIWLNGDQQIYKVTLECWRWETKERAWSKTPCIACIAGKSPPVPKCQRCKLSKCPQGLTSVSL